VCVVFVVVVFASACDVKLLFLLKLYAMLQPLISKKWWSNFSQPNTPSSRSSTVDLLKNGGAGPNSMVFMECLKRYFTKSKFPRVEGKLPTNDTGKWKMTRFVPFPSLEKAIRPRHAASSLCPGAPIPVAASFIDRIELHWAPASPNRAPPLPPPPTEFQSPPQRAQIEHL
jgi:hypothetical protein